MTEPLLLDRFRTWLQADVTPNTDGKRLATEQDLWTFLDEVA